MSMTLAAWVQKVFCHPAVLRRVAGGWHRSARPALIDADETKRHRCWPHF